MSPLRRVFLLPAAFAVIACGEADEAAPKPDAVEPSVTGDLRADVADRVSLRGSLALGGAATGTFDEDLQFDAWTLAVRPGAVVTLDVTRTGSSRSLDATLWVYGPKQRGQYGTRALLRDDDSGWGRLPRLTKSVLQAGGEYLVVVGTQDGQGRGAYRLVPTCVSGDCAPPALSLPARCPEAIGKAVRRCVGGQVTDPEHTPLTRLTPEDALTACVDAEPFAVGYDAHCAEGGGQDYCSAPYEDAWRALSALCQQELAPTIRGDVCVFGASWRGLERTPGLFVTAERTIRQASQLKGPERQQAILAVQAAGFEGIDTVNKALAATQEKAFFVKELWSERAGRPFIGYEFAAGDTSLGAIFEKGTTVQVARNRDGDLYDCTVAPGVRGESCGADAECGEGLRCYGQAEGEGPGRCVAFGEREGDGLPCSLSTPCAGDQGMLCAGLSRDPQNGLCLAAWMRDTFGTEAPASYAAGDAPLELPIEVRGLATVDMDVWMGMELEPAAPGGFTVELINPAGTVARLIESRASGWLELKQPVMGFSGDEPVNGTWRLRIIDHNRVGLTLHRWHVTVGSRFD
ncbi:MAG: proprotein convertase P-domain-containing protein [Bradymonadia bacterium]